MSNIEERAEALLQEAESTSSVERISEILDQHWACFDMDMCEICEYLEEEHYLDLLFELASNENITVEQQSRVVDAAFKWQGKIMGVMISLASNRAISDEHKEFSLDTSFWYGTGEAPDVVTDFLEAARENPDRYSEEEIAKFVQECVDEYGFEDE